MKGAKIRRPGETGTSNRNYGFTQRLAYELDHLTAHRIRNYPCDYYTLCSRAPITWPKLPRVVTIIMMVGGRCTGQQNHVWCWILQSLRVKSFKTVQTCTGVKNSLKAWENAGVTNKQTPFWRDCNRCSFYHNVLGTEIFKVPALKIIPQNGRVFTCRTHPSGALVGWCVVSRPLITEVKCRATFTSCLESRWRAFNGLTIAVIRMRNSGEAGWSRDYWVQMVKQTLSLGASERWGGDLFHNDDAEGNKW
jgi:hypothetical protein